MFRSTKTKVVALALVGAIALGGAIYTTTALAVGGASAAPAPTANATAAAGVTAQTTVDPQLRAGILDMLKERMGLTGANAETFADQMIAYMQSVNPNFDLQGMVNWCNPFIGDNANGTTGPSGTTSSSGWNMMGGSNSGGSNSTRGGYGMMGAAGPR